MSLAHLPELTPFATVATAPTVKAAALTEVSYTKAADAPAWHIHTTCGNTASGNTSRLFIARALLGGYSLPSQHAVHRVGHIAMYDQFLPSLLFNHHIEGGWRFTLQDTLLGVPPPCLLVTEGHSLDTAYQV